MKLAPILAFPTQQEKRYVNNLLRFSKRNRDLVKNDIIADLDSLMNNDINLVNNAKLVLEGVTSDALIDADEEIERMLVVLTAVIIFYLRQLSRYLPISPININNFYLIIYISLSIA